MRADTARPSPALEQRFRSVHATSYADLVRFVERRIPRDDAEDVVSTTFLAAWRRVGDMPEDARPWLFGIARNLIRNSRRGADRRHDLDVVAAAAAPAEATSDPTAAVGRHLDLVRAWSRIGPRDRETLALVAFDDLTAEQAATVLGCRRSTFTMRLTRARRRLQSALDDDAHHTQNVRRRAVSATSTPPAPLETENLSWHQA
ncbi:MAG: RNA polymerase sigma factor [Janthinobacterium lividum]